MTFFARLPKDDARYSTNALGLFSYGNVVNQVCGLPFAPR